jgi:hypothetical protein
MTKQSPPSFFQGRNIDMDSDIKWLSIWCEVCDRFTQHKTDDCPCVREVTIP